MRASPRISVLGESGDPCIVGNGPSKDHKTEGLPKCVSLTSVAERATDTFLLQQETITRGDLSIPENRTCQLRTQSAKLFLQRLQIFLQRLQLFSQRLQLFSTHSNSFLRTCYSIRIVLWLSLQPTQSAADSFHKLLENKSESNRNPF